jgi:hypothetical protein
LESGHQALDAVAAEDTEEIVFEGEEVSSGSRVALAATAAAELRKEGGGGGGGVIGGSISRLLV